MSENTELISQYIDRQAIQQDTEFLLSNLKEVEKLFDKLNSTKISLDKTRSTRETFDGIQKSKGALTELGLAMAEHKKIVDATIKSQARLSALSSESAREYAKEKEALRQRNQELKNQVREENNVKGSIEQRRAALIRLQGVYDKLSAVERDTSYGKRLQATVAGVSDQLKKLEGDTGRFQRIVGDYKKGFDGLGNSVAQMTREFPAFTYSVQTGFLALSNNLPIFFDEIKRAKNEIKAMRAEGKETQSLLGRLAGSFFSFGTVLSVGITLLTVYGKEIGEFFSALFKGKQAMDQFTESQRLIGEALKASSGSFQQAVKDVSELRINIDLAKQGLIDKEKIVKQYNESIGKVTGEVKNLDEAEQALVKNGDAYIQMMLLKAAANLALEDAAKAAYEAEQTRRKQLDDFTSVTDFALANTGGDPAVFKKQEEERKKQNEQRKKNKADESEQNRKTFEDIAKKFQQDAAAIAQKYKFDLFGGNGQPKETALKSPSQKFFADELKAQADGYKKLSEQDTLEQSTRINAREKAAEIEARIISGQRNVEIQNEIDKLNAVKNQKDVSANEITNATREFNISIQQINKKAAFDLVEVEKDLQGDILDIKGSSYKRQKELDKQNNEETLKSFTDALQKKLAAIQKNQEDQLTLAAQDKDIDVERLNKQYQKRISAAKGNQKEIEKIEQEFADKRANIEFEYAARVMRINIAAAEQIIAARKTAGLDTTKEEKALTEARIALSDLETKHILDNNKEQIRSHKEKMEAIAASIEKVKYYADQVFDLIGGMLNASIVSDKNRLQEESDLIDKRKAKEIESVNSSVATQQDKANKIAIIEARANVQKEAIERRQRQLEERQARFNKAKTISDIILTTAQAVVGALRPDGVTPLPARIALAAVIGAIGAAQLAVAIATPIPKYAKGTGDKTHPGGPAIVGDGGRPEFVLLPGGQGYITPDKPTLMNLPKGSEVFPNLMEAMKLNLLLAKPQMLTAPVDNHGLLHDDIRQLNKSILGVQSAIRNKKEFHSKVTHRGLQHMEQHVHSWIQYVDDQINF